MNNASNAQPPTKIQEATRDIRCWPNCVGTGLLLAMILGAAVYAGYRFGAQKNAPVKVTKLKPKQALTVPDLATPCKPGPWGNLEYVEMFIEAPEEYLSTTPIDLWPPKWVLPNRTEAAAREFLAGLPMPAAVTKRFMAPGVLRMEGNNATLTPTFALLLELPPEARLELYAELNRHAENQLQFFPIPLSAWDEQFNRPGVSPATVELVRRLSFNYGKCRVFADFPAVAAQLEDYDEKIALLKALSRTRTLLLKLHLTPDSNLETMAYYWSRGDWGLDVRSVFQALSGIPGGARVDINTILPPLPSGLLYTFPRPTLGPQVTKDCHWTSLNFFRDPPDTRMGEARYVAQVVKTSYYPVLSSPRYGDVVRLLRNDGTVVHSALYLADDIVYTKNGKSPLQPWILMHLNDMVEAFSAMIPQNDSLRVDYLRGKYY